MVIHINNMHKIDGVNFVKPSDIFAKLFEAIPNEIPTTKNKYPNKGFIINLKYYHLVILFTKFCTKGATIVVVSMATGKLTDHALKNLLIYNSS
tara:strand:- start:434 stop:715 length:282 start_codon:yes stop_codon:yes gene_type:complete